MIVLEYLAQGNLRAILAQARTPDEQLIDYASQISCGLEYLHSRRFVHLDLACRNILVSDSVVKISDFGLSQVLNNSDFFLSDGNKKLPVRLVCFSEGKKKEEKKCCFV